MFPVSILLALKNPKHFCPCNSIPHLLADSDAGARSRDVGVVVGRSCQKVVVRTTLWTWRLGRLL